MTKCTGDDGRQRRLGKLFSVAFVLFNAAMAAWLLSYWGVFGEDLKTGSDVERAGTLIDATATVSLILLIWVLGALITGALALLAPRPRSKDL